jgi:hypothetical protein
MKIKITKILTKSYKYHLKPNKYLKPIKIKGMLKSKIIKKQI